ncbi:MAG: AAA family ATPase [Rikenellaceae bacterium]
MAQIKTIRVEGLFGIYDLEWSLLSGVNILSGGNGSGKSTLLRALGKVLLGEELSGSGAPVRKIEIESQGSEILPSDVLVVGRFGTILSDSSSSRSGSISKDRFDKFCEVVSRLFESSGKRIVAERWHCDMTLEDIAFVLHNPKLKQDITIEFQWLSAGEQLAVSLLWAVASNPDASILVLDEPEISLSLEWQKVFLDCLLEFSGDLQIIVATHSPALIMRGWLDRVTEIEDIIL